MTLKNSCSIKYKPLFTALLVTTIYHARYIKFNFMIIYMNSILFIGAGFYEIDLAIFYTFIQERK